MPPTTDYSKSFDPTDKDAKTIEKCIIARIEDYTDLYDEDLWNTFREDFSTWTEGAFRIAPLKTLINLRDTLRTNGVYVAKGRQHAATTLSETIAESEQHEWTESEVIYHVQRRGTFSSLNIELTYGPAIRRLQATTPKAPQQAVHSKPQAMTIPYGMTLRSQRNEERDTTPTPIAQSVQQQYNPTTPAATTLYEQAVPATTHSRQTVHTNYTTQDTSYYGANISQLRKAYSEDLRYGNNEDTFDYSYQYFLEMCGHMGIHTQDAQRKAFFVMLKGEALRYYFDNKDEWVRRGINPISAVKSYFETEEHLRFVQSQWDATNLASTMSKNPDKPILECLEIMLRDLQRLYSKIRPELRNDVYYHSKLVSATRLVPACHAATGKPSPNISSLIQDLRSSISQWEDSKQAAAQHPMDSYYTDRRYYSRQSRSPHRRCSPYGRSYSRGRSNLRYPSRSPRRYQSEAPKTCHVCHKPDCWSTNHTEEERQAARRPYEAAIDKFIMEFEGQPPTPGKRFESYLAEIDEPSQYDLPDRTKSEPTMATGYFTVATTDHAKFSPSLASELANRSAAHYLSCLLGNNQECTAKLTPSDEDDTNVRIIPSSHHLTVPEYAFLAEDRYSSNTFIGLLIDTGAAAFSTAGYAQYLAFRKVAKNCTMDTSTAGSVTIRFGAGNALQSLGSIDIETPVGNVRFHIIEAMTPFLFSIKDLDRLKVYYDNTKDLLIRSEPYLTAPIVRRFGHPFLIWDYSLAMYISQSFDDEQCFLTDTELCRLHRRFGHPSVGRLHKTLQRAGYDTHPEAIEEINKFCHHCQTHGRSPGRFRFTLQDDIEFNHSIIVDIMYINGKPVLHIVDEATRFNAACWLTSISAKATWDALRMLWIDTYLGPPDFIVTDAGKNFVSKEFTQLASSVSTMTVSVPVEAHWSIGAVERYHAVLRRSYEIISEEVPELAPELALQMAVKAVNDTAGPDGYVPTLLVFGAYPRMTEYRPPAPTVAQRAAAVKKAMTEVRRLHTVRQINDALNTRNGPSSTLIHRLPLNSDVLVWREGGTGYPGKWKGPYKLISIDGETCTIDLPNGPTKFRSTVVKPYHKDDDPKQENTNNNDKAEPYSAPTAPLIEPSNVLPPPPKVAIPPYEPNHTEPQSQRPQRERRLPPRYKDDLTKPLRFNGAVITEDAQGVTLTQERTCKNIRLVQDHPSDTVNSRGKIRKNASPYEQDVAQRALAQATQPDEEDIKALNKRLKWQADNPNRGLRFVKIDLRTAQLYAFVDASFANNKDSSSQIGYIIVLADAQNNANILHWSSTKCKRITRSVLASEMYGMANGFDAAAAIKSTLTQLLHLLEPLPLVLCTDSKSLYECLVKLGTTREKRLMIDLMCLRQSYERQEITEVRWINGNSNPADAMTKSKPCRALQELIDTNKLRIDVDGWVERPLTKRNSESKNVRFATPVTTPAP
ncbi:conserved hypothetical protein [Talaromyces stipitatus ATCC 10500]|uniref:Integrase catalytic domain-containing protein n=1 Tax=Talaromyces stipitatus (strain ATCC 10500 / CBS 375.48 / QM 6759 / NRRL 1006) TaxID=441959 RepID=B8M3Y7_TALSN|nr:uncharacterized protein TSTA_039310 [Talaromyces stipitatus ATCC 10500]EED20730.1 conserved hypothetical protein [Talaromyces stipitatus ATCC 10500]